MSTLAAFEGCGIELEYMIVDRETLSVLPVADDFLRLASAPDATAKSDIVNWSNELVEHVVELKNPQPLSTLEPLPGLFQDEIQRSNRLLEALGAQLMPSAMHPWMNPQTETRLWQHDSREIYQAYDRIFNCKAHGWANLQSMHINLPFASDEEFARLHAAIRLLLPILPALGASSPIADSMQTGLMDSRMEVYRGNAAGFPSITGQVVPQTVNDRAEYDQLILAPMYREIALYDPDGILQFEWLNSRGAIARFDRNAIEIRVLDMQECPKADIAIAAATIAAVKALFEGVLSSLPEQQAISTESLTDIMFACTRDAEQTIIENSEYLRLLSYPGERCEARELWWYLIEKTLSQSRFNSIVSTVRTSTNGALNRVTSVSSLPSQTRSDDDLLGGVAQAEKWRETLDVILEEGPLAWRISRAVGGNCSRQNLREIYARLCECLDKGRLFLN